MNTIEILKLPEVQQLSEVTGELWEETEVATLSQPVLKPLINQEDCEKGERRSTAWGSRPQSSRPPATAGAASRSGVSNTQKSGVGSSHGQ